MMTVESTGGRVNQKQRTYQAILHAAGELIRTGDAVTMPAVAKAALVSEATAYRYFPDLATLMRKAVAEQQPEPAEVFSPLARVTDPVRRVEFATEHLLRHVLAYESGVRATIAATIGNPAEAVTTRPGMRFGLIDEALAPWAARLDDDDPLLVQLKRDLTVVIGAESLFFLLDSCGLTPQEAIASVVHTATTLTTAAVRALRARNRKS